MLDAGMDKDGTKKEHIYRLWEEQFARTIFCQCHEMVWLHARFYSDGSMEADLRCSRHPEGSHIEG
jgi:hypothetical protein